MKKHNELCDFETVNSGERYSAGHKVDLWNRHKFFDPNGWSSPESISSIGKALTIEHKAGIKLQRDNNFIRRRPLRLCWLLYARLLSKTKHFVSNCWFHRCNFNLQRYFFLLLFARTPVQMEIASMFHFNASLIWFQF